MFNIKNRLARRYNSYISQQTCPIQKRHDDLYLVSYPKSGVTWLSCLLAYLGLRLSNDNREVTVFNVQDYVPDIHVSRYINLDSQMPGLGFRVIKSHSYFNPDYKKVIYLVRDPRDVIISYWYYLSTLGQYHGSLSDLLRAPEFGVDAWSRHVRGWLEETPPSTMINFIRYEDLKARPQFVLKHLLSLFGLYNQDELIDCALDALSFENMRNSEIEYSSFNPTIPSDHAFMRKGKSGGWREEISESDLRFVENICGNLMSKFNYGY